MARAARKKYQWVPSDLKAEIMAALAELEPVVSVVGPKTEEFIDIDFNRIFREQLKISPKRGGLEPFNVKLFQCCLNNIIRIHRRAGIAVRIILLKTRQRGGSAWAQAVIFVLCKELPFRNAITITHQAKSARKMFARQRIFYNKLPDSEKEAKKLRTGTPGLFQLEYDTHGSVLGIDTAGGEEVERSSTNQYIHGSEVAYWKNQKQNLTNLMKTVPDKNVTWDTFVVWESTANGTGDEFEKTWRLAERGMIEPGVSDWLPVFLGLKTDEEAWDDIVPGKSCAELAKERGCDPYEVAAEWGFIPDKEEEEYAEKWEVWPELLKWCRRKRNDECSGDWDLFNQEYPISPEVAFFFTGMSWYKPQIIKAKIEQIPEHPPLYTGDIQWASIDQPRCELTEESVRGPLKIYEYPDPEAEYSLGGDCSEGVKADYYDVTIIRNSPPRVAARYRINTLSPIMQGVKSYQLGAYYGMAFAIIERNGPGFGVLSVLQRPPMPHPGSGYGMEDFGPMQGQPYPNLFYQVKGIEGDKNPQEMERAGWGTDATSKETILRHSREVIEHVLDFEIWDPDLLYQMEGFKWVPPAENRRVGKWVQTNRDPKTNLPADDGIISFSLANQARLIQWSSRITSGMKARRAVC